MGATLSALRPLGYQPSAIGSNRGDPDRFDSRFPIPDSRVTFRSPVTDRVMPRRYEVDPTKGVLEIEWPLFGELSRALALKVARDYDPEIIVGVATAGVVPGAVVAAILDREFHSIMVSRRYRSETVRQTPAVMGAAPIEVRGGRVLIVDETCDSGATMRLAVSAIVNAGAGEVRTAVSFRTGQYEPDFYALATDSTIILPWDREVLVNGELVPNPMYAAVLGKGT
jgi:hypoxanthine phosphoribosyltransferase